MVERRWAWRTAERSRVARGWSVLGAVCLGAFLIGSMLYAAGTVGAGEETAADPPTETPIPTDTDVPTDTPTETPEPTETPTDTPVPTAMPTEFPSPTPTEEPSATATPTTEMPTEAATPSASPTATPTATVEIEALGSFQASEITLTITTSDGQENGEHVVSFGTVRADGANGGVPAESGGAYYVKSGAVTVTVIGADGWTGSCSAQESEGSSSVSIEGGALAWRVNGATTWTDFTTSGDFACFDVPGETTFVYDYRLHVAWSDTPGDFQTVITYGVSS